MEKFYLHIIDQSGRAKSQVIECNSSADAKADGEEAIKKNPIKTIHVTNADGTTVLFKQAPTVNVHLYRDGKHLRSNGFDVRVDEAKKYAEGWGNNHPEHYALVQTDTGDKLAEYGAIPEKLKPPKKDDASKKDDK